jgi:hypothetical protein
LPHVALILALRGATWRVCIDDLKAPEIRGFFTPDARARAVSRVGISPPRADFC